LGVIGGSGEGDKGAFEEASSNSFAREGGPRKFLMFEKGKESHRGSFRSHALQRMSWHTEKRERYRDGAHIMVQRWYSLKSRKTNDSSRGWLVGAYKEKTKEEESG